MLVIVDTLGPELVTGGALASEAVFQERQMGGGSVSTFSSCLGLPLFLLWPLRQDTGL